MFRIWVAGAVIAGLFAFTPVLPWMLDAIGSDMSRVYAELYALIAFFAFSAIAIFALIIRGGAREPEND